MKPTYTVEQIRKGLNHCVTACCHLTNENDPDFIRENILAAAWFLFAQQKENPIPESCLDVDWWLCDGSNPWAKGRNRGGNQGEDNQEGDTQP